MVVVSIFVLVLPTNVVLVNVVLIKIWFYVLVLNVQCYRQDSNVMVGNKRRMSIAVINCINSQMSMYENRLSIVTKIYVAS
jgi:hypothetical protein